MKNKKANFVIDHIGYLILGLILLAAVLMFIFKGDILSWVRSLPDYTYDEDNKTIQPDQIPQDQIVELDCQFIAVIGNIDLTNDWRNIGGLVKEGRNLFICNSNNKECSSTNNEYKSNIMVQVDNSQENQYTLGINTGSLLNVQWIDVELGKIESSKVSINEEIIKGYFDEKNKEISSQVSLEELKLLDQSNLIGKFLICKSPKEILNLKLNLKKERLETLEKLQNSKSEFVRIKDTGGFLRKTTEMVIAWDFKTNKPIMSSYEISEKLTKFKQKTDSITKPQDLVNEIHDFVNKDPDIYLNKENEVSITSLNRLMFSNLNEFPTQEEIDQLKLEIQELEKQIENEQ